MRYRLLALHAGFALPAFLLFVTAKAMSVHVVSGAILFMSVFALIHDAIHHALALPRWANELVLTVFGALMGVSGTAARSHHVIHHARPGAPDDLEGMALRVPLRCALWLSPRSYFRMAVVAARRARPMVRRRQLGEWALVLVLYAAAVKARGAALDYAMTCLALQLTIPLWAGLLPHRSPLWLVELARALAWTRSPLVVSFAYHDVHHAHAGWSVFDLPTNVELELVRSRGGAHLVEARRLTSAPSC